jgi:hypothetical protein
MSNHPQKTFRITLEQLMFATVTVQASDEETAAEIATRRFLETPGIFSAPTPEGWDVDSRDVEFHCAEEVRP